MSFDKPTRNRLSNLVGKARERLKQNVIEQLQTTFGLQPDGMVVPLESLTHLTADQRSVAADLRAQLAHFAASEAAGTDKARHMAAYDRLAREIGFTILNRLAALRLCEERGLVVECVRRGMASDGFALFDRLSNGALGTRYQTYRVFLENLFDELALDLGVLFDRHSPLSHVFPTERALEEVLNLLNDATLAHLWHEDETIGWMYQDYNDKVERKKLRSVSRSPRNSRELAVRNQFFTPRYVVEFLTDNTLGRIWYEMRGGETALKEKCRYLVIRQTEDKETRGQGDTVTRWQDDTTMDVASSLIPSPSSEGHPSSFREKKDPRRITMLDPAGGSGHFGLYCFDLFETIYTEAYDDPDLGPALQSEYPDRAAYLREVPRLILRHNLHIIDIDPRACQIAALALWLRAQRSWQAMGVKAHERPRVTRVNVVCAEPMPGESDLLDEFVAELQPTELGELVRFVFEWMQLAGEAGSLLKIEEELHDQIEEMKAKPLFTQGEFWDNAEAEVLRALQQYAERASNGRTTQRRLFADDAVRGFAFIDLCFKRYDAVLMNPPFGELSNNSKSYIEATFPRTKGDILANFVERALQWSDSKGLVGVISSRTCFYLGTLSRFRKEILQKEGYLYCLADLGDKVLEATVETAAYVLQHDRPTTSEAVFMRALIAPDKEYVLMNAIEKLSLHEIDVNTFIANPDEFSRLNGSPYCYWVSNNTIEALAKRQKLEGNFGTVRVGLQTGEDWRFLRMFWEVPQNAIATQWQSQDKTWVPFSRTDFASPWFSPILQLVLWHNNGRELRHFTNTSGKLKSAIRSPEFYFHPGFSYMLRSTRLVPYIVPTGVIPTAGRAQVYPNNGNESTVLGYCASNVASAVARFSGEKFGWPKFQASMVQNLPVSNMLMELQSKLSEQIKLEFSARRRVAQAFEPFQEFTRPAWLENDNALSTEWNLLSLLGSDLELEIAKCFDLSPSQLQELERDLREAVAIRASPSEVAEDDGDDEGEEDSALVELVEVNPSTKAEGLISYLTGCAFGRWDIRLALDPTVAPKLQDPFDPLPVCPPGMLVAPDGLPAITGRIVSEAWLRARPNAITLPPEGAVKQAAIPDVEYPLRIAWDGILVDDAGLDGNTPQPADIVRRVREALELLWPDRADAIEQEACEILGVKELRDYFRKPSGFFADHLKRYSKSRRQAPIYWPLSTASGSYTLWLYYHRLTSDTLYAAVTQYVNPKIADVEKRVGQLEAELARASGRAATELRGKVDEVKAFLAELHEFKAELLRVAALPYKPNLNDGVIINAAPLHKLFGLKKWAKDCRECWEKLASGAYDWAHLAYTIWPERVREVCKRDRSIAIAHGLESLCEVAVKKPRKRKKKQDEDEDDSIEMELQA